MAAPQGEPIEFRLLGKIEAVRNDAVLPLGGQRQRALLALLVLGRGRPVSADRLADELWAGRPPEGASTTLRSYVSKLRSALGKGPSITGGSGGYAIAVDPQTVDAQRFERLAEEGREALERGAASRAAERLREGLELWRGRPFGDLGDEGSLRLEAERLEELRLHALEGRIEADLALGKGGELVEELETLVRTHPYRERFWRQLMLALYRADRQADALAAYRRAREVLDEELGLEPSEELRQLEQAILRHDVEEAKPPEERHNLPAEVTTFVGRQRELGELEALLGESRMVTITGVGGTGKTRLALETGRRVLPEFPDGVFLCDLAPLPEDALVPHELASVLGVQEQAGTPIEESLVQRLRDSDLVLLLDNCEHLIEAAAVLAARLLAACPRLRILATSREPLGIPGEVDYPLAPLALPKPDADVDEIRGSEAVSLFLARARTARPQLSDNRETIVAAGRICSDLDGLPLAIELAAARAKALSLEEVASRLADRFRFLVSWRRLTPARHRTLEEAMEWSYDLLPENEKALLARLSVFAGGFSLQAAAAVCLDGDEEQALELVQRLVDASLVVTEEREGEMRYRLLETVREYARQRLEDVAERDPAERSHAEWCLALAEQAEPELTGERQTPWFSTLEREHDNLRAALAHAEWEPESRLRLAVAMTRFWYVRGHLTEARTWLEHALEQAGEPPLPLYRRALTAGASFALLQGDYGVATELAEKGLAAARESGEPPYVANALSNLGAIVLAAGDYDRAADLLDEAVTLARKVGDERIAALAINNRGDLALTLGNYEEAEPLFEESLELLRARGDTANVARSLFNLGAVALKLGRLESAEERFHESIELSREVEDKEDLAWCLEGFAGLAAERDEGERAAFLLGAAGAVLSEMGADFKPFERGLHDATEARARELCGDEAFEAAVRLGAETKLTEVFEGMVAEARA
jgi:predicted ATPase/DNA-binding winged helix-turn-helix (wHTH) protein